MFFSMIPREGDAQYNHREAGTNHFMVISGSYGCKFVEPILSFAGARFHVLYSPEQMAPGGKQQSRHLPYKVVLADDDEDDRMFFTDAIHNVAPGTNLVTVNNGEDLIRYLKDQGRALPDLIFMDINMPYKNGLECLREIKSSELFRHLPILIYSTSVNKDHVEVSYTHGACLYIQKPANYTDITRILKNVLDLAPSEWFFQRRRDDFVIR